MYLFIYADLCMFIYFQSYEGGPPMLLKEEPDDDRQLSFQKVPSLSDLSDPEASLGECCIILHFNLFHLISQ